MGVSEVGKIYDADVFVADIENISLSWVENLRDSISKLFLSGVISSGSMGGSTYD